MRARTLMLSQLVQINFIDKRLYRPIFTFIQSPFFNPF
jgi:hypothetical protein